MAAVTDQEWSEYKDKFNKKYADDEDKMRRDIFVKSKVKIEEHNKKYENGDVSYKMAINHLSDCTADEMAKRCGKRVAPTSPQFAE
ncbi:protein CTLA-2-beta [Lucilia sericata]|uniref:protein CTLA-2-beta n=1 Tax=Lucilia sericata TaxID=13632 RepID=UPI0018A8079C|nr:protein CTLA-2-beta [Lucilia sericata]